MAYVNALQRLREYETESRGQFESLALQYKRFGRDYAAYAQTLLGAGAVWDGQGQGLVSMVWPKLLELEHKRETLRVGDLGALLNAIEVAGDRFERAVEIADQFAEDHQADYELARQVVVSELLRQCTVRAITVLKNEAYGMSTGGNNDWNPDVAVACQSLLRTAVALGKK